MREYSYLIIMFFLVIIGLAAGLGAALWINQLTDGAVFEFGGGVGTIGVIFGSCSLGVFLCYLLGVQIEKAMRKRDRKRTPHGKTYDEKARIARKQRRHR